MSHLPSLEFLSNPNSCEVITSNGSNYSPSNNTELNILIVSPTKLQASLRMIDSELEIMGYSRVLCVENGETKLTVDSLANNMLLLLRAFMKNVTTREELETTVRRYESDLVQTQKMYHRCKDNLEDSKKVNDSVKERERRLIEEKKVLSQQLKAATEEVRKLQLNFQRHETQFNHERRKMEKEIVSLKERLATVLCKSVNPSNNRAKSKPHLTGSTDFSSLWSLNADPEYREILAAKTKANNRNQSLTTRENYGIRRVRSNAQTNSKMDHDTKSDSSRSSWTIQDTASLACNVGGSQADLYSTVVQQLEARQHDLLYENREVRDLISQLSSKLVRFSLYINTVIEKQQHPKHCDPSLIPDDHFDSLDEDDEELDQNLDTRSSSDDETPNIPKSSTTNLKNRRKSADVNKLLLELPYPLVRDHLIRRIRQISRNLWKQLKQLAHTNLPIRQGDVDLNSTVFAQPLVVDKENSGSVVKSSSLGTLSKPDDPLVMRTQLSELQSPISESRFKIADVSSINNIAPITSNVRHLSPIRSDQSPSFSSSSDIFRTNWARAVFTESPFPKRVISSTIDSNKQL